MNSIPYVTVAQMREVDHLMVEDVGVSILMMMENASRNIAFLAREMLGGSAKGKNIVILCGKGNNGGDGLGAARHLTNLGASCRVFLAEEEDRLNSQAKTQYAILEQMRVEVNGYKTFSDAHLTSHLGFADLIIDALLGYNLQGNPREPTATLISFANKSQRPILAVDLPSGLDADTGQPYTPTIKAYATITLALPKVGLLAKKAKDYLGDLYLADLSVPRTVYEKIGINVPVIFEKAEVVKISTA